MISKLEDITIKTMQSEMYTHAGGVEEKGEESKHNN